MVRPICLTITGASPSVGSSSSNSRAPVRSMRPIASICCSPPESLVPWLESRSFRFGNSVKICSRVRPPSLTLGGRSRFSSTFKLEKIPRSSGHSAIPRWAIRFDGRRIVSRPSSEIEHSRRPTMPMIDFMVVVLPAPFRPRSVTTSPAATSKATPCRMCDSPYQAFSSRTASSDAFVAFSGMPGSEICLDHIGVLRHCRVIALSENLPAGENRDVIGKRRHHGKIVLDHQHRAIGGDFLDQRRDPVDIRMRHARGGLVEQHHFRVERERRRDFQCALAAIGKLDRRRRRKSIQADGIDQLQGACIVRREGALGAPEIVGMAGFSLKRNPHVLEHGQVRKYRRDLERAYQPPARDRRGPRTGDLLTVEKDLATGRDQEMREQIETGGLAGAVGTDQGVDGPALDGKIDAIDGDEAFELLGQAARLEYRVVRHAYVWGKSARARLWFKVSRDYPVRSSAWQ